MATPLKYMRQEFKKLKWALYAVIFVFVALIFVQWGMGTDPTKGRGDFVAMVDDERITYKDFIRAYENQREMLRQFYKDRFSEDVLKGMDEMVLNNLVDDKVIKKQAQLTGLNVSSEELKSEILKIPAFKKEDGSFVGFETYRNILAANQYTPKQFEENLKEDVLKNRYRKLLTEVVYISEEDLIEEYKKRNMTLTADYIYFPFSSMEGLVKVEEGEVRGYYEKIKDQFWQPEKRKISYLLVDYMKLKGNLKVSEEEIRNYYENNLNEFERKEDVRARHILIKTDQRGEEKARELANQIYEKLKQGEDFAKLASQYSEDPGSKGQGGDLGYFERGRMVPEFEEVAFSS
ncbi:MAG: SurA N-terminal domain-containing protein, partial [Thermoanaerobaculia bacterium]